MASKFNLGSVAFLDLLTCGLGAVLLLFFIVVAVRESDSIENMNTLAAKDQTNETVFIQLSADSNESLFTEDGRKFYWEKNGLEIERPKNVDISDGESFLLVYTTGKMPEGASLKLTGLNTRIQIQGLIFDRFGSRTLTTKDLSKPDFIYRFGSRPSSELK